MLLNLVQYDPKPDQAANIQFTIKVGQCKKKVVFFETFY